MKKKLPFFFSAAALFFFLSISPMTTTAQTTPENQVTADENYQLNISENRVTEIDYARSTQVKINAADNVNGVSVGIGAAVRAGNMTITLRGVTGSVRFRASLESLRRRIEELRTNRNSPVPAPNP